MEHDCIPSRVRGLFDGSDLGAQIGRAYLLMTTDPDGPARPCMLSAGEILAVDERRLRVGLWTGSHTSRNLTAGSPVLLCVIDEGGVIYLRGRPQRLASGGRAVPRLDCYEIVIDRADSDEHGGMPVSQGIRFAITGMGNEELIEAWRSQLAIIASARYR